MGMLRDRMEQSMRLKHLSDRTVVAYLYHMREYTRYFGVSPDWLGEDQVRELVLRHFRSYRIQFSGLGRGNFDEIGIIPANYL